MDALLASYGDASSSDSETESGSNPTPGSTHLPTPLPPPPIALLNPPNSLGTPDFSAPTTCPSRVRSFPHVEGNFSLHVYIPVTIPLAPRKEVALFMRKLASLVPELHVVDVDIPLSELIKDDQRFEQIVLGREFHVSLGRTVPVRIHQRDSIVNMLRQRLQSRNRYWIDFNRWEVFTNAENTRTFLSLETTAGGLVEIKKQIEAVNEVYRLHNLQEFYQDPRPHISLLWASDDISSSLKKAIGDVVRGVSSQNRIFSCMFGGIMCKIGNKNFEICKIQQG